MSRYDAVASAPTWAGLQQRMLDDREWGRVDSVRIQARGEDVTANGHQDVVRVVDLLDRRGRRLAQVDVWRAGVWGQCID